MPAAPLIGPLVPPALVLVALIPLGSVPPIAEHSIAAAVAFTFLAVAARAWMRNRRDPLPRTGPSTTGGLRTALFGDLRPALLLAVPLLPFLQWMLARAAGFSAGPEVAMLHATCRMAALAAFFVLCYRALTDRRALGVTMAALVVVGALEGGYAVLNLLSGNEHLLFYPRTAYESSATGTLVSRNHFALLMEILLPLSAVLAVARDDIGGDSTSRDQGERLAKRILLGACIAFQALALLLSQSRSGIAAALLAAALVYALVRALGSDASDSRSKTGRQRSAAAVVGAGAVVALALAAFVGLEPLVDRFAEAPRHFEAGRAPVWKTAVAAATEAPIFGHGWGTFGALASAYRPEPTGLSFEHAHSDYLEVLAETGLVGFGLAMWLVAAIVRRTLATLSTPLTHRQRLAVGALAASLFAVLIHSLADFGLRVPGVAMTFVAVLAMFYRVTAEPSLIDGIGHDPNRSAGGGRGNTAS